MNPVRSAEASIGAPVNPVLGVKFLAGKEDLDFTLEGPLPLLWQRSYRSTNTHVGWFGQGWGCALEVSLQPVPDRSGSFVDHIDYIDPFGRHIAFPYVAPGGEFFLPSEHLTLSRTSQGQYRLEDRAAVTYWFNPSAGKNHRVAAITDRNGNAIHIDYFEQAGELQMVHVSCSGKQQLEIGFVGSRLMEVVERRSTATGLQRIKLVRYEYTGQGDLCVVINRASWWTYGMAGVLGAAPLFLKVRVQSLK